MSKLRNELQEEVVQALDAELASQAQVAFDKVVETDWKVANHNALTNAGGAAAILSYMGSASSHAFAIVPLSLFLIGVIASGIELKALFSFYSNLHANALLRRHGFTMNQLTIDESVPKPDVGGRAPRIKKWAANVSQLCFAIGCFVGVVGYLITTP